VFSRTCCDAGPRNVEEETSSIDFEYGTIARGKDNPEPEALAQARLQSVVEEFEIARNLATDA